MSKLEDLVPPLDLCQQIHAGKFADSALVWELQDDETWWEVILRSEARGEPAYPAPTLAEIMEALDAMYGGDIDVCAWNIIGQGAWGVQIMDMGRTVNYSESDTNPATAALRLWLEMNERKKENA